MTQRAFLRDVSEALLDTYDYIICADANTLQSARYGDVFALSDARIIGFSSAPQAASSAPHWFSDKKPVYSNAAQGGMPLRFSEAAALKLFG